MRFERQNKIHSNYLNLSMRFRSVGCFGGLKCLQQPLHQFREHRSSLEPSSMWKSQRSKQGMRTKEFQPSSFYSTNGTGLTLTLHAPHCHRTQGRNVKQHETHVPSCKFIVSFRDRMRNALSRMTAHVSVCVNTMCALVIRYMKSNVPAPLPLRHTGTQCFSRVPARPVTVPVTYETPCSPLAPIGYHSLILDHPYETERIHAHEHSNR